MHDDLSRLVHAVLRHGLRLKERLDRGDTPSLEGEQAELRRLLQGPPEAERWPDYVGDAAERGAAARPGAPFLGLRYALACWLDELFILHSSWDAAWNERKLEAALYGTNDRAWRFWEQAALAEARPDSGLTEIYYLCAVLGFRGELREAPERLASWVADARARVTRGGEREWPAPPRLDPPTAVPPLRGRNEMRRMAVGAGVLLLFALPVLAFLVVRHLAS